MKLALCDVLPNSNSSLDHTGFIFGAGASVEAGYPTMAGLTRNVVGALSSDERLTLDEVLGSIDVQYDAVCSTPNIEEIADVVMMQHAKTRVEELAVLERRLRELIVEVMLGVSSPSLENHCRLIHALKKRTFGRATTIWIFTTNYDLLFERAAAECGVRLENGFVGSIERFFDPQQFRRSIGTVKDARFSPDPSLTLKLVKLHGSLSWEQSGSHMLEKHERDITPNNRIMILPRRTKAMDTLATPYEQLFKVAQQATSSECKYMVSCGFSYSDKHIDQHILLPPMQQKKLHLTAMFELPPSEQSLAYMNFPNFHYICGESCRLKGQTHTGQTKLWKFSEFCELFG